MDIYNYSIIIIYDDAADDDDVDDDDDDVIIGEPKAIPYTHATPIKCAVDGYLQLFYHNYI